MRTTFKSALMLAVAGGALLGGPRTAFAEMEADESSAVQEVIVTAQRREQRLQEAPVAVTALSQDTLEQLNISNAQDLMQVVPSLQVSTQTAGDGGGSATFFLRGMGQQRSGNGSEPAIGIYVDDFYYPSLSGTLFDIVDLAQLEVLRGPQGTLFGRNTIGGAIRYTTRAPTLGEFEGHVTGTIGRYDRYDISGAVNVPLGEIAALRLTAGHLERDGYVRSQNGQKDAGATQTDLVRAQARIEPTSTLYVDLSGQWSKSQLDGFTYTVPGPLTPRPPAPGGQPTLPFIYNLTAAARGLPLYTDALASQCFYCQPGPARREFSDTTYKNAFATIGWEIAEGLTLKSLTGWQKVTTISSFDLDSTIAPIFGGGVSRNRTRAVSQELQLNGRLFEDRLNFVAGAYYYDQHNTPQPALERPFTLGARSVVGTATLEDRKVRSYAGYLDGSFKVTDQLTLLGGLRRSQDRKKVQAYFETGALRESAKGVFNSTTFRVGAQYQWNPDVMTYASVSKGFRGGGFNPYDAVASPHLQAYEPETSTSYEAGARLQFMNRRITINPTVFYMDWNKIQVQSVVVTDGVGSVLLQNAGTARSYGAEIEASAAITDDLRVFGNLAYLDIKYTDLGRATGITLDTKLQRAPKWTFSFGASQTFRLDSGASIVATANYSFQDDQFSTPTDSDKLLLPSYGLVNGRLEFRAPENRFSVAAYVTNLFDEKYFVGGVNYYSNVGAAHFDVGRPREVGVTGRLSF